jgi:hypothetical protein
MNTYTIDETQPTVAGKTGAKVVTKDETTRLARFIAPNSSAALTPPPPSFSVTKGVTKGLNMLGNDEYGDCVVAATEHARMFKALVSFANGVMTFLEGFRPPHAPYCETLYWAFGISQGEPGPHPDNGCDPASWFAWFFKQRLCDAFGQPNWEVNVDNVWQADLTVIKNSIVTFGGVMGSFALPVAFQGQFNVVPFSYEPGQPMANDGHEMFITGYDDATQLFEVCTWGVIWHATYDFVRYLLTSCFVFVSKEDAQRLGVNFDGLVEACEALAGAQGIDVATGPSLVAAINPDNVKHDADVDWDAFTSQLRRVVTLAVQREGVTIIAKELGVAMRILLKMA